jgi:hypothetical protein
MASTSIVTLVKMVETLPEEAQNQVVEYLRAYIADMNDDTKWDNLYQSTQDQLDAAARQVRKAIAEGQAEPMDFDRL